MITKSQNPTQISPDEAASSKASGAYVVISTNWSINAQNFMKPHIITAIDTNSSMTQAAVDIFNVLIDKYGGTAAVNLQPGYPTSASNTNFYYYAQFKSTYISIFSSD